MKKILALVLTLAMMLTMFNLGFVASAAEYEIPAGAQAIATVEDLAGMQEGGVYKLTADIHVGQSLTFATGDDGKTYTIGEPVEGDATYTKDGVTNFKTKPVANELVQPAKEYAQIVIPAGVTLYGNGYTIYQDYQIATPLPYYNSSNQYSEGTKSLPWSHAMFKLSEGDTITFIDVDFGSVENPIALCRATDSNFVYCNYPYEIDGEGNRYTDYEALGISRRSGPSGNDTWSIFEDLAGSNVVWQDVNFNVRKGDGGLGELNLGGVIFQVNGTHDFTDCSRNGYTSAGTQCGGWFQKTGSNASITMTNCVVTGDILGSYASGWTHYFSGKKLELTNCHMNANVTGTGYVAGYTYSMNGSNVSFTGCTTGNVTVRTQDTYSGGNSYTVAGFVSHLNLGVNFVDCVNNANVVKAGTTSHTNGAGGFIWKSPDSSAAIVNFTNCVNNGNITTDATINGGFVGRGNAALNFENCVNNGDITVASGVGTTSNHGFGGFGGHISGSTSLTNCVNNGDIKGAGNIGGLIGRADGGSTWVVSNCVNTGKISVGTSASELGGIMGQANVALTFENCVNYGAVTGTTSNGSGGILGRPFNSKAITFESCANYGANYGSTYSAGIVAYTNGSAITLNNCANYGNLTTGHTVGGMIAQVNSAVTINKGLNAGTIGNHGSNEGVGGFIGRVDAVTRSITITDSANIGTIKGSGKANATYGYFGDTVGQFIGLYTVSAVAYNYANNNRVGGFINWGANGAVKPTLTNCSAFGNVVLADGALSLSGWITADEEGTKYDASSKYYHDGTLAVIPNNGVYGINVEINPNSTVDTTADVAELNALATALGIDFMAGGDGENAIVVATPAIRGYQVSTDGTALRVVSALNSFNYTTGVGYTYTVSYNGEEIATDSVTVDYVLENICANTDAGLETYTAADFAAKYLMTVTFTGIDVEGTLEITVTPTADGYEGEAVTLTIVDGVVVA